MLEDLYRTWFHGYRSRLAFRILVHECRRIVYVVEDDAAPERYGFAYGTLPDHAEIGEERFTVEFNPDDQTVWYDIYAFSRPRMLTRLAYPLSRGLQKRFARNSLEAMRQAVQSR